MFVRIVRMSFDPLKIEEFLQNFHDNKNQIRNFEGCTFLELYRDKKHTNIFFTYSYWNAEKDLENYRNSIFFKDAWGKISVLFNDTPLAWSVEKIITLE